MSRKRSTNSRFTKLLSNLQIMGIKEDDIPEVKEAISNFMYGVRKTGLREGKEIGIKEGFTKGLLYTGKIRK